MPQSHVQPPFCHLLDKSSLFLCIPEMFVQFGIQLLLCIILASAKGWVLGMWKWSLRNPTLEREKGLSNDPHSKGQKVSIIQWSNWSDKGVIFEVTFSKEDVWKQIHGSLQRNRFCADKSISLRLKRDFPLITHLPLMKVDQKSSHGSWLHVNVFCEIWLRFMIICLKQIFAWNHKSNKIILINYKDKHC